MTKIHKPLALLLCIGLIFSLCACSQTQTPTPTAPPTEPAPTEPPATEVYAAARDALSQLSNLTLDIQISTTTTIADQEFTVATKDILTYTDYGTDSTKISLKKTYASDDDEESTVTYSEIFSAGTVYITLGDYYLFSSSLTAEECSSRYLPAVLLDESLYGEVTAETSNSSTTIHFASPTAAEHWAIPEDANLLQASGTAVVDASGSIKQMTYSITYQYGAAEIKLDVTSKPRAQAVSVVVPQDTEKYKPLQHPNALLKYYTATELVSQAKSITTSSMESVFVQAAAVIKNQSVSMDFWGCEDDSMFKAETNVYLKDFRTNQDQKSKQDAIYRDGKYVVTVDDGVPTSQAGIAHEEIAGICFDAIGANMVNPGYWQDASVTDLGSTYLIEFTFTEDLGNTLQNGICYSFWQDAGFLNNMASAYVTNETTGYIALDKYTGLPTSAGYYYEGTHTIGGTDYTLTLQTDQSIEMPSLGAYHAITEEMPPEEEPETKATPLFYHVTGDNNQEMWLLGTIHVGDERTAYLPQEIYDAFTASDALALEFNSKAFEEQSESDDTLQSKISDAYYYSDTTTADKLGDEELYETAVKYLKASGNYNMNAPHMKASIWSQCIENFYMRQGYALTSEQGLESRLEKLAEEQGKEIRDVESGLFQIQMTTGWSDELQKLMLEDTLETNASEYWQDVSALFEKWCAGDEAALREAINEETDTSELTEEELAEYEAQLPLAEEYDKAMSFDRNEGMLKVAIDYLESGETVFYAVGLAHLLDDANGLVDALREAGYTVELVEYAG